MRCYNNSDEVIVVGRTPIPPRTDVFIDDAYLHTPWAKKMRKERVLVFPYYGKLPWTDVDVIKSAAAPEEPTVEEEPINTTPDDTTTPGDGDHSRALPTI
jgi:hypothetical protein